MARFRSKRNVNKTSCSLAKKGFLRVRSCEINISCELSFSRDESSLARAEGSCVLQEDLRASSENLSSYESHV